MKTLSEEWKKRDKERELLVKKKVIYLFSLHLIVAAGQEKNNFSCCHST